MPPYKDLGQNFLHNTRAVKQMVSALDAKSGETIIEIGGGMGAVTRELVEAYGTKDILIKVIEVDHHLVDKLKNMFPHQQNLEIIEADVLEWLPHFNSENREIKLIGSLPYYITSPILHELLRVRQRPQTCVILVQKEVAEKIRVTAPDSVYLSVLMQTFFEVEDLGTIDKSDFSPAPQVDGGVLKLIRRDSAQDLDVKKYVGFLRKAFANPRKMLNKTFRADELNRAQLNGNLRPQDYGWQEWSKAFRILV